MHCFFSLPLRLLDKVVAVEEGASQSINALCLSLLDHLVVLPLENKELVRI